MTTTLHAQPYDISAAGFYFTSADDYAAKAKANRNDYGGEVEEYEIQFIDGEQIDCALARSWEINQANFPAYFEAVESWDDEQKTKFIIAVGECGYSADQLEDDPDSLELEIYPVESLRELAEQFVEEGLFGDIPDQLTYYLDHDAIARDLAVDYAQTEVAGERLVYRCG